MIYFNNAASSWPKAPGVIKAMMKVLNEQPSHPGRTLSTSGDPMMDCRKHLAGLIGTDDPKRIVLTANSTQALNIAILGLGLRSGSKVITTVTEHNSVLRPLNHLRERIGIRIAYIGLDESGQLDMDTYGKEIESGAELVVVNHASNVTGRINDVKALFARARESGATTLLDASQSLGHIPFQVDKLHADLVAFTGHKGLHGPPGTGGLYVAPHLNPEQIFVGGTGVRSDLILHPPDMPIRLEAGTPNIPAFAGLTAALSWYEEQGEKNRYRENQLAQLLRDGLRNIPGVFIYDDIGNTERIAVTSFRIKRWTIEETGYILEESFGIISRTGLHCAPLIHKAIGSAPDGTVRFSLSVFNTESEIRTALSAIRSIAG